MDESPSEAAVLRAQLLELQNRVEQLSRTLDRAVELIGLTGETLGRHLSGLAAEQVSLARRIAQIAERLDD